MTVDTQSTDQSVGQLTMTTYDLFTLCSRLHHKPCLLLNLRWHNGLNLELFLGYVWAWTMQTIRYQSYKQQLSLFAAWNNNIQKTQQHQGQRRFNVRVLQEFMDSFSLSSTVRDIPNRIYMTVKIPETNFKNLALYFMYSRIRIVWSFHVAVL